ncbi:autotransporter assembly complex family protein [soil metagenome]
MTFREKFREKFRRSVRRCTLPAAVVVAVLLSGCGSLMQRLTGDGEASKAPAPPAERAVYRLEVDAPSSALRTLLSIYLDLARFQNLPVTESITVAELDRLVSAAPAQARSLLETEGYFNSKVEIVRDEAVTAQVPASQETAPGAVVPAGAVPTIRVQVVPGPRTTVQHVDIEATGPLKEAADKGDSRAGIALAMLVNEWPLKVGEPFLQAEWATAKNISMAQLRANGYAAADWSATSAQVDAENNKARLAVKADSGPLFLLGDLRIEGLQRYSPTVVQNLAGFTPGTPYSEKLLLDFQERLQKVGLFEGVVVEIDPDMAQAKSTPVTVRVRERSLQQTTLGAGISANTGERVTLEHLQRNFLGTGWQARNKFELGRDLSSWQGELTSPPDKKQWRDLIAGSAEKLTSGDEVRDSISARIGRTRESERMDRLYYAELLRSSISTILGTTRANALWGNYNWVWRNVDSVLLPTRGTTASLQLGSGYARSDSASNGVFGRAVNRFTFYRPFGNGWYGQARIEAGQVFANDNVGIPDTLLFRAGGDDSVRGYAYRSLGPEIAGVTYSGRVLMTSSVEIARPILASIPTLWGALFIDAGNAAQNWNEMKPAFGYGAGVRLRSPVGPVRVDLAYGQEVKRVRLHLSVGVTF